jgi:glyoxylase-like metal-dependent hydrolase (beta-lactamase superfamily II)
MVSGDRREECDVMRSGALRRAHVAAAAVFTSPAAEVWRRFQELDDLSGLAGVRSVGPVGPGSGRLVVLNGRPLGIVETITRSSTGIVAYRARVPGGSVSSDVDAVIRVSEEPDGMSRVTWTAELITDRGGQGREEARRWFGQRLAHAGGRLLSPLTMDVWVGSYRTVASPGFGGSGSAGWVPTTATLIAGETDAVLVDALLTADEASGVVSWLRSSGKTLTAVLITHGDPDHFFGLDTILRAFPGARAFALADVIAEARTQASPGSVADRRAFFADALPERIGPPRRSGSPGFELEGHLIQLLDVGRIGGRPSGLVSVRDLDAVVGGDLIYNGVHPALMGTDRAERMRWSRALDLVDALRPAWAVAAHRNPHAATDAASVQVEWLRRYLDDFEGAAARARTPLELVRGVRNKHPEVGGVATLQASAAAYFADRRG